MNLVPVQNKLCQHNASTCQHDTASTNKSVWTEDGTAANAMGSKYEYIYIYTCKIVYVYVYVNIYIYICIHISHVHKSYIQYSKCVRNFTFPPQNCWWTLNISLDMFHTQTMVGDHHTPTNPHPKYPISPSHLHSPSLTWFTRAVIKTLVTFHEILVG